MRCSGDAFIKVLCEIQEYSDWPDPPSGAERLQVRILSSIQHGLSCSKAGEKHLQCSCEEFDSLTGPHVDLLV